MDADSGGVLFAMLPPYAASQAVAPLANWLQLIPLGTVQLWRSLLKALASYSTATGGWPRGVSVNASRGRATEKKEWGGPRTLNMSLMSVTELVSQLPMGWLKALAPYSIATDGWPRGVSVNASRGRATEKKEWGGPRTENM